MTSTSILCVEEKNLINMIELTNTLDTNENSIYSCFDVFEIDKFRILQRKKH